MIGHYHTKGIHSNNNINKYLLFQFMGGCGSREKELREKLGLP